MKKTSPALRIGFAIAAVVAIMALSLHIQNWYRGAAFNWPNVASMSGLFILMTAGAVDLPHGIMRITLSGVAILLIFISFICLVITH